MRAAPSQASSFKDRWQRSHAEMQNLIARQAREKETMQTYAVQVSVLSAVAEGQPWHIQWSTAGSVLCDCTVLLKRLLNLRMCTSKLAVDNAM
jgi:hypothetical protein